MTKIKTQEPQFKVGDLVYFLDGNDFDLLEGLISSVNLDAATAVVFASNKNKTKSPDPMSREVSFEILRKIKK